jgi:hypothetical protein
MRRLREIRTAAAMATATDSSRSHPINSPAMFRRLILSLALLSRSPVRPRLRHLSTRSTASRGVPDSNGPKTDLITFGTVTPGGVARSTSGNSAKPERCARRTRDRRTGSARAPARASTSIASRSRPPPSSAPTPASAEGAGAPRTIAMRPHTRRRLGEGEPHDPGGVQRGVLPNGSSLHVLYRLDGEYSVSGSDPAVTLKAPQPSRTARRVACAPSTCRRSIVPTTLR